MMYFGKCRSKVKVTENDLERSNVSKGPSSNISLEMKLSSLSNGTLVLKISWLPFEFKYILCPKVENFDKFKKYLKCCSFLNNHDNQLRLGVC